jgi:bile acid-coenzyme A ligase
MLQRIARLPDIEERDLSSLEYVMQGGASTPDWVVEAWLDLIGDERFFMSYGSSEGVGLAAQRGDEWRTHRGSTGRGYRAEIKILDADARPVPTGELGEIYLRSPMYDGYEYLGGAALLRGTDDGFQTAGDLGHLDDDGYLYLVDRRVDMIVTGGANVFPAEVEAALIEHPAVADVVVIGLRDEAWGRRVHAVVEPSRPLTGEDVIAWAKARLAPYKVPKTVELVDALPRSEATKVNRGAMVEARGG